MKDVLEVLPEAAAIVAADGTILAANSCLTDIFGYTQKEIIGQSIELFVPYEFREQHAALRIAYMQNPTQRDFGRGFYFRGMKKNGSIINLDVYLGPLPNNDILVLVRTAKELENIYLRIKSLTQKLDDLHTKEK